MEPRSGNTQITEIFETIAKLTLIRVVSFGTLLRQIAAQGIANLDFLLITSYTDELIENKSRISGQPETMSKFSPRTS